MERVSLIGLPAVKGITPHKTWFGSEAAILVVLAAANIRMKFLRQNILSILIMCLAVLSVIMSNSVVSILAALFGLTFWFFIKHARTSSIFLMGICSSVVIVLVFISMFDIDIFQILLIFNRDSGLTGRGYIWGTWLEVIQKRVLIGYGYSGFFGNSIDAPAYAYFGRAGSYMPPNFHNTFLDVTAELGIIGLLLFCYPVACSLIRLWRVQSDFGSILLSVAVALLVEAMGERTFLHHTFLPTFVLFIVIFYSSSIYIRQCRTDHRSGNTWKTSS
ncbi:O-antigen ligase family protein [Benzoatithermus flavus]|uniref:O-antigen ligase family protein n=1 Tax=Benzoatithermus flavus TaxID=3108223 RepID=A0ABU8XPC6_9PROT